MDPIGYLLTPAGIEPIYAHAGRIAWDAPARPTAGTYTALLGDQVAPILFSSVIADHPTVPLLADPFAEARLGLLRVLMQDEETAILVGVSCRNRSAEAAFVGHARPWHRWIARLRQAVWGR